MDFASVWQSLRDFGTEQNRKIYERHGIKGEQFGVSFAKLRDLAKKIRVDHELAERLWATGNHDARVLATMVADTSKATAEQLRQWANDLDNYVVADAFSRFVSRTQHSRELMEQWMKSQQEFVSQTGWNVLAAFAATREKMDLDFTKPLQVIEENIQQARNRARHAMNNALIAIALRSRELEKLALATASRIGPVAVDHGQTECETPDVAQYVAKAKATRRKMAARRKVAKAPLASSRSTIERVAKKTAIQKAAVKTATKRAAKKRSAVRKTAKKAAKVVKKTAKKVAKKVVKKARAAGAAIKAAKKRVAKKSPTKKTKASSRRKTLSRAKPARKQLVKAAAEKTNARSKKR